MTTKQRNPPAHLVIRDHLLAQIRELPPNARLPTEVALAAQFGVSRLTVHKTVMRLQQEGIVVRRGKGGTFVAREAHRVEREGGRGRNGTLAIAYPNWFSYDYWLKVDIAERLALQHGLHPLSIKLNPETPIGTITEMAKASGARGLLLMAPGGAVELKDVRILETLGCPCVLLQPNAHVRASRGVYAVAPDNRKIGRLQIELLADLGHRRIAYVREEPWSAAGQIQLEGMRDTIRERGLPFATLATLPERTNAWSNTAEAGYERTRTLMTRSKPPTAILYDALSGAHAGIRALHELGLRVPADVSVLVSAPNHPFARYDWPRIGSVSVPSGTLVERAVELLLHPPATPRVWIDPVIDPRESVAAPPEPRPRSR